MTVKEITLTDSTLGDHLKVYKWRRKGLLRRWEKYPVYNSTLFTWDQTLSYLWDKYGIETSSWVIAEDSSVISKLGRSTYQIVAPQ